MRLNRPSEGGRGREEEGDMQGRRRGTEVLARNPTAHLSVSQLSPNHSFLDRINS